MTSLLLLISQFILLALVTILTTKELNKKYFLKGSLDEEEKIKFKTNYIENLNTGKKS